MLGFQWMTSAKLYRDATSHRGRWLYFGVLVLLWGSPILAAAENPIAPVVELHAGLLAAAEHRQDPFEQRYGLLLPLIVATHDLGYIGQFTIRRQWAKLTTQQQADFASGFRRLAVANYVARFGGLHNASFDILGDEALPRGRHQVSALLRPAEAEPVTLTYVLHQTEDGPWKVINVVANGVSDLALKRAEYQRILRDGDFAELLEHIGEQSQRLAEP